MARTPVPGSDKTAITAFLVTPDMPGFEMIKARMEKMGIRGTATARFALRDVKVPKENILGPLGQRLEGCADGSRFRADNIRRVLHRRGENCLGWRSSTPIHGNNSTKRSAIFIWCKRKSRASRRTLTRWKR